MRNYSGKNYIYQLTTRGLCSELNSLLAFYDSMINKDCQIFIDASQSQYFKSVSIFDVFNFPSIFVDSPCHNSTIISGNQWKKKAVKQYKTKLTPQQYAELFSYTDDFQNKLNSKIGKLSLNEEYNCLHIRRGDKVGEALYRWTDRTGRTESKRFEFEDYFNRVNNSAKTIFIFTDDYRSVSEGKDYLRKNNIKRRIVTLTKPKDLGHSTDQDLDCNKIHTENDLLKFLGKIEVSKNARQFIGTRTSNIFRYIKNQSLNNTEFISLD